MKLTMLLIGLCLIGFIPLLALPDAEYQALVDSYGFSGQNLIERPYVLITSIFLHGSLEHLLSNILVLFFFGIAVESEMGWKMLVIFFLGAFFGDLLSLFTYSFKEISIGASGGIFALIGTGILVKPFDLSFYPFIAPVPLAFLGISYALYNIASFLFAPEINISYVAHIGGLMTGLAFGLRRTGLKKGILIIIIFLAIVVSLPIIWKMAFG